jgi:ABC-type branched-subunit amino acid transport system ATPase component
MKLVRLEGRFFVEPSDIGGDGGPNGNCELEFSRIRESKSMLAAGEQTMLRLALYFWTGGGVVHLDDLMSLEPTIITAVGELIVAEMGKGSITIDQWIEKWQDVDAAASYFAS